MPSFRSGPAVGRSVSVKGLAELQSALRRTDGNALRNVRRELRKIANDVRGAARGNISHRSGRHGNDGPTLAASLKVSVRNSGVSVYSDAAHGRVQDEGGHVGRSHATLLRRGDVSQYLTRAAHDSSATVSRRLEGLLDDIENDFAK